MQLDYYTSKFSEKTFPIILICENVTNAPNVGSLFRTADAFGVDKLIFCADQIPLGRKMTKTSRATEKYVNYEISETILDVVEGYKEKGFQIIALEITENSIPIQTMKFNIKQPVMLIVGAENHGISSDVLKLTDTIIHIEMYGQNSSMNVVQATSVALYEITKQLLG